MALRCGECILMGRLTKGFIEHPRRCHSRRIIAHTTLLIIRCVPRNVGLLQYLFHACEISYVSLQEYLTHSCLKREFD